MISIEVHTEELEEYLSQVELQVMAMQQTLIDVAHIVELNVQPLVPVDTGRLMGSFVAVPTGKSSQGWVEVEIGYSVHDPRDNYDYAEYTHTGIDYRTGSEIQWKKPSAQREYLIKGIVRSEDESMRLIEGDYLSLFKGAKR